MATCTVASKGHKQPHTQQLMRIQDCNLPATLVVMSYDVLGCQHVHHSSQRRQPAAARAASPPFSLPPPPV
jgi:hypothetical protein